MSIHTLPSRLATLAAGLLTYGLIAAPAHAFSDDEARRAILELRQQVQQITEQNRQARIQLADQLESLQQEVAKMRGQLELLGWESEMAKRANEAQTPDSIPNVGDPQEQAAYEAAAEFFRAGNYKEAATGFSTFLDAYPNSQLAPEAQFYQGSSRYASKDFKGSIAGLRTMVRSAPDSPRAPDALLVVAAAQIELGDLNGAKASLQQIVKDYPQTTAAETAKSRLQLL
jgi:tol-pal system protein YbgF